MCEINYIAQLVETFLMMTFFDGEILSVYAIRKISKISIFRPWILSIFVKIFTIQAFLFAIYVSQTDIHLENLCLQFFSSISCTF